MRISFGQNSANLGLEAGETFYLGKRYLRGHREFDYAWPFRLGSPFLRWWFDTYWLMRRVSGGQGKVNVPVRGYHGRGTFHALRLAIGERYSVAGHCIAGFSGNITNIKTHIKLRLPFWILLKHFFCIFEGPGTVLLYSQSSFEVCAELDFQTDRIVAFSIDRSFTVLAPSPTQPVSKVMNLFSTEVVWRFLDSGLTIAERHMPQELEQRDENLIWRIVKHCLAFLRF